MKYRDFVGGAAFLIVLSTLCAGVFWFVLHSKETDSLNRQVAFASMKGRSAPAFSLSTIEGKPVSTSDSSRPKVIEVFATWCEICTSEIPTLNRLAQMHPEIDVVAITGSKNGGNSAPETLAHVKRYKHSKHVLYALAYDPSIALTKDYKVVGFPSIYVINKKGIVTFDGAGAVSFSDLDAAVKEASI